MMAETKNERVGLLDLDDEQDIERLNEMVLEQSIFLNSIKDTGTVVWTAQSVRELVKAYVDEARSLKNLILIAKNDGYAVGFAVMRLKICYNGEKRVCIDNLYVDKVHRDEDVVEDILLEIRRIAKVHGWDVIHIICPNEDEANIDIYERFGMKAVGTDLALVV